MTHSYACIRLLQHGPLTFTQLLEITGWPRISVEYVVRKLVAAGILLPANIGGKRHFALRGFAEGL